MQFHSVVKTLPIDECDIIIPVGEVAFLYEYKPTGEWKDGMPEYKCFVKKVTILEHHIETLYNENFYLYRIQDQEAKIYDKVPLGFFVGPTIGAENMYIIPKEVQMNVLKTEINKYSNLILELTNTIQEYNKELELIKQL